MSYSGVKVDKGEVYCTGNAVFPEICVKTGVPTDSSDFKFRQKLYYSSTSNTLFYFLTRKKLIIEYTVSKDYYAKYKKTGMILKIIMAALFASFFFGFGYGWATANIFLLLVLFILNNIIATPLTIKDHTGTKFQMRGCCKEFMSYLREEQIKTKAANKAASKDILKKIKRSKATSK